MGNNQGYELEYKRGLVITLDLTRNIFDKYDIFTTNKLDTFK